MILPIVAYGDPILKKEAEEIKSDYPGLKDLIEDMFETMYNANGVGLAAPQIAKSIRVLHSNSTTLKLFPPDLDQGILDRRDKPRGS